MNLNNYVVMITGGSSDIGSAVIARIHREIKCRLLVSNYKTSMEQEKFADRIINVDLSGRKGITKLCEEITREKITHYIQLQGYSTLADTLDSQSFETLDINMNVNLFSTVFILKTMLRQMRTSNFGRIVLISTASAEHGGGTDSFGYGLAKHSVAYLVKHIAKSYSASNILANCVSPGFINTKMHELTFKRSKEDLESREKFVRVGRSGNPEDVANIIFELVFNNNFITGENIKIDGGDFI
jgi:3-oxoacyl-[acyl-carrier protein] reductase